MTKKIIKTEPEALDIVAQPNTVATEPEVLDIVNPVTRPRIEPSDKEAAERYRLMERHRLMQIEELFRIGGYLPDPKGSSRRD